jgi:O-antigen ligase/polysaccharide polymerase Wzy-like membrane protein
MREVKALSTGEMRSDGPRLPGLGFFDVHRYVIPLAVAAAYVALAAAGGGYKSELRAGAAILVWWAVIVGLSFGVWPRVRIPGWALLAGGALLALTVLSGLSIGWASDDGAASAEAVRAVGYLGLFVLVVVASPAGSARLWLAGLAVGLVAVAALALGSRIQPSAFPEQDLVTLLPSVSTRLSYPLNYWNGLAACMAAAIVLLAWLGGHARGAVERALAVAALPVPALALFLTSSRGGVVALTAGLLVLLAAGPARARMLVGGILGGAGATALIALANAREAFVDGRIDAGDAASQGHEMLLAILLVVAGVGALRLAADRPLARLAVPRPLTVAAGAAVAIAAIAAIAAADPAARLDEFKHPPDAPAPARGFVTRHLASAEGSGRYQFWESGLDAFASQPVRGVGAGGYESWWAEHGSIAYHIRDAHSLFVEVLAELGILGLLALLCFLGAAAAGGIAARRREPRAGPAAAGALALLACATASAAIDWTWELPAAFVPLIVAAAMLAGPALGRDCDDGAPRFGLGFATLVVAWLAVVASAIVLVGETKLADSREAVRRDDLQDAASDARAAQAIQPWSSAPYLQLALVRERSGDLTRAREAARDAVRHDSDDWRVWLVVTRLAVRDGDVAAARTALRQARRLNPRSPLFARRPSPTAGPRD